MFDLFSTHQIHFQLFFEVAERGKYPNAYGDFIPSFEYENPFLAYSILYLGIWILLQNYVLYLE